jgi:colanic acid biosynthesis glycosyl transferase WcaI
VSNKKILIHSIVFSPDGVSTAYLYNDIATKFAENDYEVIVLTTTPHYNLIAEELAKQPLRSKYWGIYYESFFRNIRVIHIPQKKFKSPALRILGFIYWHLVSLILGLLQKNISLILSPSPPLTIGVINIIIAKIKGSKVIYNVQEIYPDFLINQKELKIKPIITFLKYLEKNVYNYSDAVVTIDAVFYNTIISRFKDPAKLHIIPNFVDTTIFKPIPPDQINLDLDLFPLSSTLKVMYAGNIGHAQDWESLLDIASRLVDYAIEFFVIGEGVMKQSLEDHIQSRHLNNIHLIPYQSRERMPQLIAYADLHFIFMTKEMESQGFPSKVYTVMACNKPLLIVSGRNTPINNFLTDLKCAFIVDSERFEEKCHDLIDFLKIAMNSPLTLQEMGSNGHAVIEKYYTKDVVTIKYVDLANKILA